MTIAEVNTDHLARHLNQLGYITVLNSKMYKCHLVGYIRSIYDTYFIMEDNETGQYFKLPLPATFKKIPEKKVVNSEII